MSKSISISTRSVYISLSVLIVSAMSWSVLYYPLYTFNDAYDFWEHSATIREWSRNLWHPHNPHLAIDTGSPRYMPFFFLLSLMSRTFDLDPIKTLGIGGIINMILLLSGIWLFLRIYFGNDNASLVGLIVLLAGWGIGWLWSNFYQLRSLFYVITYPSSFAFALTFVALWIAKKILSNENISFWNYIALGIISALILLSHPLTGAFAIMSICLMTLLESNVSFASRCKVIAVVIAGALAAELWPYYSVWHVISGTSSDNEGSWIEKGTINLSRAKMLYFNKVRPFYNIKQVLVSLGPSLFGVPALIYLGYRKKHIFIVAGFIVMIVPYLANLVFPVPLGHRFLFYSVFYLHLALIWGILEIQKKLQPSIHENNAIRFKKIKSMIPVFFLSLCLAWNLVLVALEFEGYLLRPDLKSTGRFANRMSIVEDMKSISQYIPDNAIILAPVRLSWPLPTFKGKVVALSKKNPMVSDYNQRKYDTNKFFENSTSQLNRQEIISRYKVTHILYKKDEVPEDVQTKINSFDSVITIIDKYILMELKKNN